MYYTVFGVNCISRENRNSPSPGFASVFHKFQPLETTHTLRADGFDASEDGTGRGTPLVPMLMRNREGCAGGEKGPLFSPDQSLTLAANANDQVLFQPQTVAFEPGIAARQGGASRFSAELSPTLRKEAGDNQVAVATAMQVRRLTPRECERLQGFPDDYTRIPWRKAAAEDCPDGPRYKALGNSWAVPCARWIGERIQMVEKNRE